MVDLKARVYIETTVVSCYLTARPSRDVVIAGHQQTTHDWWRTCRDRFDLVASQLVMQEARAGDPQAAQDRLNVLATLSLLETTEEAMVLAQELVRAEAVPEKAAEDALRNSWRCSTMWEDPIVAEVRKAREAHAAQFNYDLKAIYRDLKRQEKESGQIFVSFPPRRVKPVEKARAKHEAAA